MHHHPQHQSLFSSLLSVADPQQFQMSLFFFLIFLIFFTSSVTLLQAPATSFKVLSHVVLQVINPSS